MRNRKAMSIRENAERFAGQFWDGPKAPKGPCSELRVPACVALRGYDAFLQLTGSKGKLATYALLDSIALYCALGCNWKAFQLAAEIEKPSRTVQRDLARALEGCAP
jgi:hypothetical protein